MNDFLDKKLSLAERYNKLYNFIPEGAKKILDDIGIKHNTIWDKRDCCIIWLYYLAFHSSESLEEYYKGFFTNRNGKPITSRGVRYIIKKWEMLTNKKIMRSQDVSMRHRVLDGRMIWRKRKRKHSGSYSSWKNKTRQKAYKVINLDDILGDVKLTKKEISERMGVSYKTLLNMAKQKTILSPELLEQLISVLKIKKEKLKLETIDLEINQDQFFWAVGLREFLKRRQMTMTDLAKVLKKRHYQISRWVHLHQRVDIDTASKIAVVLNGRFSTIFKKKLKK
ncbi:MAG: helix-turn-helix domain-containing protein [Candidatus Omnitrophica bacterium]|nr:helix-turn-helix domain-containing protein [Candidatus Omnitrophota bacterium]MCF7897399.1 helix-turn-helix domain-containing protein [Candidatus Omnitrophota bacterium]MCF7909494.1 helix-turn-helix domain-containing protein [Candidatus Omnitrophota bacterium]